MAIRMLPPVQERRAVAKELSRECADDILKHFVPS
jgi:hypothetical protein